MAKPTPTGSMTAISSMTEEAGSRASRRAIALAVAALHALAIWLLSAHLSTATRPQRADSTLLMLVPDQAKPGRKPLQAPAAASNPANKASLKRTPAEATPSIVPIAIVPAIPQESNAAGPEPAPGLSQRALDGVGKAVADLRKEGLLPETGKPEHQPDRFEKAIASAARVTETTTETFTGNDGHVITRVSGPGGTYCVMTTLDSDPDGMDRGQRGLAIKKVHCPH